MRSSVGKVPLQKQSLGEERASVACWEASTLVKSGHDTGLLAIVLC